jgi:hypothetical protein
MTRLMLSLALVTAFCVITTTGVNAQQRSAGSAAPVTSAPTRAGRAATPPAIARTAPKPAPLTNRDVIQLVEAGLSDSLVLAAIGRAAATNFQLDTAGLIALKQGGVSEAVIAVMLNPDAALPGGAIPTASAAPPAATTRTAPSTAALPVGTGGAAVDTRPRTEHAEAPVEVPRDPGIYVDLGRTGPRLIALEPTAFSQGKTGGVFMSAMTGGIAKTKWKAVVRAPRAAQRITTATPTFYFYFEHRSSGLGSAFSGWLQGATSPNEFVLARMAPKSNDRELIVGEAGRFGASTGTRSKDTVEFTVEKLAGGAYRVTPTEPLTLGEYAFFYATAASTPGAGAAGKLFDFGVDSPTSVR